MLVGAVLFLLLLPSLGWTWHRVLPEHAHWFIGAFHEDASASHILLAPADCIECTSTGNDAAIVHAPGFSAMQIVAIAMGLAPQIAIAIPHGNPEDTTSQSLNPFPLFCSLLDPPPKTV